MVIDPRHDHSFRIPRPDLTVTLGMPNACNRCHQDESAQWAAERMRTWYGKVPVGHQQFAEALHAGNLNAPGARGLLLALVNRPDQPGIARASAVARLGDHLDPIVFEAIRPLLTDPDPLLRSVAVQASEALPHELKINHLLPLLDDPVRVVRLDAARTLAAVPAELLNEQQGLAVQQGIGEYLAAEMTNADRPEAWLNIGLIHVDQGRFDQAEAAYRTALERQPTFTEAAVNLADLYRIQGRESESEITLRQALDLDPRNAAALHALGLSLVRQRRLPEAMAALAEAARLGEDNPRYGYVHALALNSTGQGERAIRALETVVARHPNDRDSLLALATLQRDAGKLDAARDYARRLAVLEPDSTDIRALLRQLGVATP